MNTQTYINNPPHLYHIQILQQPLITFPWTKRKITRNHYTNTTEPTSRLNLVRKSGLYREMVLNERYMYNRQNWLKSGLYLSLLTGVCFPYTCNLFIINLTCWFRWKKFYLTISVTTGLYQTVACLLKKKSWLWALSQIFLVPVYFNKFVVNKMNLICSRIICSSRPKTTIYYAQQTGVTEICKFHILPVSCPILVEQDARKHGIHGSLGLVYLSFKEIPCRSNFTSQTLLGSFNFQCYLSTIWSSAA